MWNASAQNFTLHIIRIIISRIVQTRCRSTFLVLRRVIIRLLLLVLQSTSYLLLQLFEPLRIASIDSFDKDTPAVI